MKAGKKLHGENWDASNGKQPSLKCVGTSSQFDLLRSS